MQSADKVWLLAPADNGGWNKLDPIELPKGSGPRRTVVRGASKPQKMTDMH
jgi:hypothetical protein